MTATFTAIMVRQGFSRRRTSKPIRHRERFSCEHAPGLDSGHAPDLIRGWTPVREENPKKTATWSADARRKRPFASKSGSTIPRPARPAQQAFEAGYRSQDKSAQIRVLRQ